MQLRCKDKLLLLRIIKWEIWAVLVCHKIKCPHLVIIQGIMRVGYLQSFRDMFSIKKFEGPEIYVSNPKLLTSGVSKHHVYTMRGRDRLGDFEVARRYKEFHLFRDVLVARFPGLYIPPIPKKKIVILLI